MSSMTEHETISPHGGTLVDLLATGDDAARLAEDSEHLPKVTVSERELSDLEMLTVGALSPLTGFQGEKDYRLVLETMHLENGLPWSIPVTLSLSAEDAKRVGGAASIALVAPGSAAAIAVLEVAEIYERDRQKEALGVFGTEDAEHPGVAALLASGDYCAAGEVRALRLPEHHTFPGYRLTPAQTRAAFAERGWKTVVGFQ